MVVGSEICDYYIGCLPDCSGPSLGYTCPNNVCSSICGDNLLVGEEICDNLDGPGCLTDCTGPSIGYSCHENFCLPICGDGKVIIPEECDAGPLEGCLEDCTGSV